MQIPVRTVRNVAMVLMTTVVFFGTATAFSPLEEALPVDETEAIGYFDAGLIDSTLLQRLLPLYRRPLQVPAGEAVELLDVFPELAGYLPVRDEQLARYRPWDPAARERFFSDYPVLRHCKPLLEFEYHPTKYRSTASFFMNSPVNGTPARHSCRFSIAPVRQVHLRGTADATSDYARWERRVLSVRPATWATAQLGNFTLTTDRGLLYGYFPDDSISVSDAGSNWLYGSASGWNGVTASVRAPGNRLPAGLTPSLTGFVHARPTESVSGGWVAVAGKGKTAVTCGVSRLNTVDTQAGATYVHAALKAARKRVAMELHCGADVSEENVRVPFVWKGTFATVNHRTGVTITRLPQGFHAPRSALLRQFRREFDAPDTLQSSILLARVHSTTTPDGPFRISPRCELWFEDGSIHHGSVQLQTKLHRETVEGILLLSASFPGTVGSTADGSVQGSISWRPLPVLIVASYHRYRIGTSGRWRYRGTLSPAVRPVSRIHIEPTVTGIIESGRFPRYLAGIRQHLMLFDRTKTEFLLEQDLTEYASGEHLRIEGRASFYF